ncbi:hypothetical protein DITRI_Ditri06bG0099700 [Diplodiscus trichospermus]
MVHSNEEEVAEGLRRLRPLHNFELPPLKWHNQRYLRCMKIDDASTFIDSSSAIPNHNLRPHVFQRHQSPLSNFDSLMDAIRDEVPDNDEAADDEDEFKESKQKMKEKEIVKKKEKEDPLVIKENSRPWNLRTRRGTRKVLIDEEGTSNNYTSSKKNKSPKLRDKGQSMAMTIATTTEKKCPPSKFSLSLTKKEIEEDFLAMTGAPPPRRPKKHARKLLFPDLSLKEVTLDSYKVS